MGRERVAPGPAHPRALVGVALACTLLGVAVARGAGAGTVSDPGCGTMAVPIESNTVIYRLPHAFLRAGTDTVTIRGTPLERGVDYLIDLTRGELRVLHEPAAGETLWVRACWLLSPPPRDLSLNRYRPATVTADTSDDSSGAGAAFVPRPATGHNPSVAPAGASLTVNGNKTLAVDFGSSQDAFLRQSLDLSVSGALAPGVLLTGVLSDRNVPLTPDGTTQSLQSFDRVLLELSAPQGSAALGDISLNLNRGEFARLDRRVQGMRGELNLGNFHSMVAAANAQGQYHRLEFVGVDGRQGPYLLTDENGNPAVTVVAGSEVVTVDGARMTRGEAADYAIDYERARITFTNRRPITADTRITVDYQFTLNRFRRNLAAMGGSWDLGSRAYLFTQLLSESDDRGSPIAGPLTPEDRQILGFAGDSSARALAPGVSSGAGDYDTVRVAGGSLVYVYAGPDSGHFAVSFAPATQGLGAYVDSATTGGRVAYKWVGAGNGGYRVGQVLPMAQAHQLWSMGGGAHLGPLAVELEGAASRLDLNTFSSLDDGDNLGQAGRVAVSLEGGLPRALGGTMGMRVLARSVDPRFTPFVRLEAPFAGEDWGLPIGGDLEHQQRVEASTWLRPRGASLTLGIGRLVTAGGFESVRKTAEWSQTALLSTHVLWQRADGRDASRPFPEGGRDRLMGEVRLRLGWLEPAFHVESDERRSPSDSALAGQRLREAGVDLARGAATGWRASAGYALRRDARLVTSGYVDQNEARTLKLGLESPEGGPFGVSATFQRRAVTPLADPSTTKSDLASMRLRAESPKRGLKGALNLELTNEGDNVRVRTLRYVGTGLGGYDPLGNFVGHGDYDLVIVVQPNLETLSRAATSAHVEWQFGASDAWRGSRIELNQESETRRRGDLLPTDPIVSSRFVLGDGALARGSLTQRIETELAPGSRAAALRFRAERQVSADRSDANFAQTLDQRRLSARWRTRPAAAWSSEIEGRWTRSVANQALSGFGGYARTLFEQGATAQLIFTPDAGLRAVAVLDAGWSRPEGQIEMTRTVRVGPDLGLAVGLRGRLETSVRRAFIRGPAPVSLLPSADPAGAARWQGTSRFDYRVRDSATMGITVNGEERPNVRPLVTGRAELRIFF